MGLNMIEISCTKNEQEILLEALFYHWQCPFEYGFCDCDNREIRDCSKCILNNIKWSIKE